MKLLSKIIIVIFWLILCSNISCQEKNNDFNRNILKTLQEIDSNLSEKSTIYLIMPLHSCSSCLHKAESFYFQYAAKYKHKLKFVFTKIKSQKEIRVKYDNPQVGNNVFIDEDNFFYRNGVDVSYPTIVYTESNQIKDVEIAGPDNFSSYNRLLLNLNEI